MKHLFLLPVLLVLLTGCQHQPVKPSQKGAAGQFTQPVAAPAETPSKALEKKPAASARPITVKNAPPPPRDLLKKLARSFSLPYDATRLQPYEKAFLRHPKHLPRVFERARPFLPHIVQQVEARDMPLEIALLPVVESAFNPYAHSWQGAAGLWQFTARTARLEGLKINWWYDGRRDPLASTGAALNYLQKLYAMTGDWLLALAAYNGGIGNVLKAVRRYQRKYPGQTPDFWSIQKYLPRETRHYVPQLLAVAHILRSHTIELPTVPIEPTHTVVTFDRQVALPAAMRLAGMNARAFFHLNAGYRRNATPPDGPHYLLLPKQTATLLAQAWQKQPEKLAVKIRRHRIRPGDSLIKIAKRYGTHVEALKRLNRLKGNRIVVGRTLLVPDAGMSRAQLAALSQPATRPRWTPYRHRVRAGESLWTIARRYGLSVRRLAQYNGLSVRRPLRAGTMLKIPGKHNRLTQRSKAITHTVRKGDSLWVLAQRYGVSTDKLKRWNQLDDAAVLRPGQKLIIRLSDNTPPQQHS